MKIKLSDQGSFWLVIDGPRNCVGRAIAKEVETTKVDAVPYFYPLPETIVVNTLLDDTEENEGTTENWRIPVK